MFSLYHKVRPDNVKQRDSDASTPDIFLRLPAGGRIFSIISGTAPTSPEVTDFLRDCVEVSRTNTCTYMTHAGSKESHCHFSKYNYQKYQIRQASLVK